MIDFHTHILPGIDDGSRNLVTYMAVRDKTGKYVGTAEFVQDMEFAKEHFGKK